MKLLCEKCRFSYISNFITTARGYSEFFPTSTTRLIRRSTKKEPGSSATVDSDVSKRKKFEKKVVSPESAPTDAEKDLSRRNCVNIPMIPKNIFEQLFGNENLLEKHPPETIVSSQKELRKHGIEFSNCPSLPDVNFKLPKLQGNNIVEHFYNIGEEQSAPYRDLVMHLIKDTLPSAPTKWVMKPGWHQYTANEQPKPVSFPPDDALIFDVEVCMSAGTEPTLACAVSTKHWYGWVSHSLFEDIHQKKDIPSMDINDLIPLESDSNVLGVNLNRELLRPRVIVGHNVSFDRTKIKEQYWLEKTGMRFVDTMSLHVCVSGITSYQRAILNSKDKELKDEPWMNMSSLNSLAEVHKLYCGTEHSKSFRDVFTEGTMADVRDNFQESMIYCSSDVLATAQVLKKVFPMFLERFQHPVTFAGMLELGSAYLPINSNWLRYIENADASYEDLKLESRQLLSIKADKACHLMHDEKYKSDLWMWDQDWSTQALKLKKPPKTKKKNGTEINSEEKVSAVGFDHKGKFKSDTPKIENERLIKIDKEFIEDYCKRNQPNEDGNADIGSKLEELEEKFKVLFDTKILLPVKRPLLAGYPAWYRKLCSKPNGDEETWTPGPHDISTSMQITPKLLSLCWEGFPLHYIRGEGWGFLVPFRQDRPEEPVEENGARVPFEVLVAKCPIYQFQQSANESQSDRALSGLWVDVEKNLTKRDYYAAKKSEKSKSSYQGTGVWCNVSIEDCCYFLRLPHKDGPSHRVGNPLAKDFLNKFSENVLTGGGHEAEKVLMFARMMSYWRNNRDRILEQQLVWLPSVHLPSHLRENNKLFGAILPVVVVCGTLTRRAMEPTWMTASNAHKERIGSELRSMVQAPPGYRIVGADVDSQELWIASLLGDAESGIHGGTALGWAVLAGNKATGTDPHSLTARAINISRDQAKVINYARVYGAGQNFAEQLLKQFNPTMSGGEAKSKARKMFTTTKGKRFYSLKEKYQKNFGQDTGKLQGYNSFDARQIANRSGVPFLDMFDKAKWADGTESAMFNKLESIAGCPEPVTPFLGCRLSRALEGAKAQYTPTVVNWVVQSGAVDYLHLMLVNMRWLSGNNIRFCLSFHDEVRYLVPEKYKYEAALAMHITNLYTRAFCSQKVGLKDLPFSVAFFSSVEVDGVLRKDANQDSETPSNPHGLQKGYGVDPGESLNIWQTLEKCDKEENKMFDR